MQALRRSGHSAVAARSISRGITAANFPRDVLTLSGLLWHFWHATSSETAHSLLIRVLRSALPRSKFSALMDFWRFLRSHNWVVVAFWAGTESCWKTHSWPLKKVKLRYFTTPCTMSSLYPQTPVSPLSLNNIKAVMEHRVYVMVTVCHENIIYRIFWAVCYPMMGHYCWEFLPLSPLFFFLKIYQ